MVTLQMLLGIELPIIQAPMAGVQTAAWRWRCRTRADLGSLPARCSVPMRCARSWLLSPRHDAVA